MNGELDNVLGAEHICAILFEWIDGNYKILGNLCFTSAFKWKFVINKGSPRSNSVEAQTMSKLVSDFSLVTIVLDSPAKCRAS